MRVRKFWITWFPGYIHTGSISIDFGAIDVWAQVSYVLMQQTTTFQKLYNKDFYVVVMKRQNCVPFYLQQLKFAVFMRRPVSYFTATRQLWDDPGWH